MNLLRKWDYFVYRSKYNFGKHASLTVPVDVSLELAGLCNMSCSYCYHADQENLPFKKGIMSWETAEKIVKQSAEIGVHSLKFNYRGESTINPIFPKITMLAKKLAHDRTFIDRITNSNFKFRTDREDIFEGLSNQTKVKVSYDSFDKRVFETQRRGGDHDLTTRNIDRFYNHPLRGISGTELVIQAVRTKLNKDEDLEGLCKKRWPEATLSVRDMVAGRVGKDLSELEDRKRDLNNRQSCIQAHVRLMFGWDGKATVCCPDISSSLVVGDISRSTVKEIFNSVFAKTIRKQLKDKSAFNIYDACKNCPSFESYKGFKPVWNS